MKFRRKTRIKKKIKVPTTKVLNFRFFNNSIQYICTILAPYNVLTYRIKEVFDNTFVAKQPMNIDTLSSFSSFKKLNNEIEYKIQKVGDINV